MAEMHYFPFLWSLCDNSAGRLCMVTNMLGFVNWLFLFLVKIQQNKELFNVKLIFPSSKLKQSCLNINRKNIAAIHPLSNCLRTWLPNSAIPISVSTLLLNIYGNPENCPGWCTILNKGALILYARSLGGRERPKLCVKSDMCGSE